MTLTVRTENSMQGNVTCENNIHQAYRKSKLKKDLYIIIIIFTGDKKRKRSFVYTWLRAISEPHPSLPFLLDRIYS